MKGTSLVLTSKNESNNIHELINAVINQEKRPDEMIIVDAGSTDGTIEIIKEFQNIHSWIKLEVINDVSRGRGRNLAIKDAKYDIIAVTDAGCYLEKNWLKNLVKPIEEGYDISVGYYKPYYKNDFEYFEGLLMVPDKIDIVRISSRSLAFKKKVWEKTGGYEELVDVGEDTLFHKKFVDHKFKIKYSKDAIVYWDMPLNTKELFKKLYGYGKGYWQTIKLKEFRRFLYFIIVAYIWSFLMVGSLFFNELYLSIILLGLFIIPHLYFGFKDVSRTNRASAVLYTPYIVFIRNLAFLSGFTAKIFD
ncbi:MAG: glycosyltransferase [Methanobacterium sp.]